MRPHEATGKNQKTGQCPQPGTMLSGTGRAENKMEFQRVEERGGRRRQRDSTAGAEGSAAALARHVPPAGDMCVSSLGATSRAHGRWAGGSSEGQCTSHFLNQGSSCYG